MDLELLKQELAMEDLFPFREGLDYRRLKLTEEGSYSITRRRDADRILGVLRLVLKDTESKSITDATGCIGGDTVNFALNFKEVHSIELKADNFEALNNNIEAYGFKNVLTYLGDSTSLFDWYSDVLYIDPPWGGRDYMEHKMLDLYLSSHRLDQWVEGILLKRNRPHYIFLKLPRNYNFGRLNFLSNTEFIKAYQIRSYVLVSIVVHLPKKRN
jgi:predicted RNA methylase